MVDKTKDIAGTNKSQQKKICKDISTETGLRKILDIFFDNHKIKVQEKISYVPEYGHLKKSSFKIDALVEFKNMKLAFEYDGAFHYNTVFKIERDIRKSIELKKQGYTLIRFPYYLQFTKDIAKYFFDPYGAYSDEKYKTMLNKCYEINNESDMLSPGWHGTRETPANWVDRGIEIFLKEVEKFPISVSHQLVHSLNLYKKATNEKEWLVCPIHHEKFNKFVSLKVDKKYLDYHFSHESA